MRTSVVNENQGYSDVAFLVRDLEYELELVTQAGMDAWKES